MDFLYTLWYEPLEIERVAAVIGPHHIHKASFELTDKKERVRLFSEINYAVHHDTDHLSLIKYSTPDGEIIDTMLTESEITHLNDVAHVITLFYRVGKLNLLILSLLIATLFFLKIKPPPFRDLLKGFIIIIVSLITLILVRGPKTIFYQLHTLIFPSNHQWFFYYEESLMSLIMRAPDLFGYIAIMLLIFTSITTSFMIYITSNRLNRYIDGNALSE